MTYGEFVEACRLRAGFENKSEFARKLELKPNHYIGVENNKRPPGRELLEEAARWAGFTFEDCIRLPDEDAIGRKFQAEMAEFRNLLRIADEEAIADAMKAVRHALMDSRARRRKKNKSPPGRKAAG